jgi:hypothetical protein
MSRSPVPKFTYAGDEPRYYPALGLDVAPGDVVDLDEAPDDRFAAVAVAPKPTSSTSSGPVRTASTNAA